MKTNFFRMLDRLSPTADWKISISAKAGKMTLSVLLLNGQQGKNLPPMVFSGLPEELDEGFYLAMETPVKQTNALFVNLAEHAQSIELARQAIKDKAVVKNAKNSEGVDTTAQKKTAFEDAIKKVQEYNSACKYADALSNLPSAEDYPDKKTEIDKLKAELERKAAQLNLL